MNTNNAFSAEKLLWQEAHLAERFDNVAEELK